MLAWLQMIVDTVVANPLISTLTAGASTALAIVLVKYQSAIRRRLKLLEESDLFGRRKDPFRMVRVDRKLSSERSARRLGETSPVFDKMKLVELTDEFCHQFGPDWKLMSLGDYFASLRPSMVAEDRPLPQWVEREIQAALAAALLKAMGPHFGAAVLPALGVGGIQKAVEKMAGAAAAYLLAPRRNTDTSDRAGLPLSLFAMTYVAELNYQRVKNATVSEKDRESRGESVKKPMAPPDPLCLLKQGEVGFKPCFNAAGTDSRNDKVRIAVDPKRGECVMLPNPFKLAEHWQESIATMEKLLASTQEDECDWQSTPMESREPDTVPKRQPHRYDAHSRAMHKPEPVNERFLPDLYMGWGSALCTHTQQEILKNRLLSVLLNRLACNYYFADEKPFEVTVDENETITNPDELIQALIDMGHKVETVVATHITTFGVALSVKEKDGSWTNIPLAYFMQNGYADAGGRDAYSCLPHSGLNLEISKGPLLDHGSLQHFMAIDGLCGWHSNHNADVPWIVDVHCGEAMHGANVAKSMRIAALQSIVINAVGTKFHLPLGGYGLTGVCNDSAGLVEYALFKKTNIYPLTFNGRFAMHNLRIAKELKRRFNSMAASEKDGEALNCLVEAITTLPSDINSLPSEAADQCRRQLHCLHPQMPFTLMQQSKEVVESILQELDDR